MSEDQISRILAAIEKLADKNSDLAIEVAELRAEVKNNRCPAPGLCNDLHNDIKELESRVRPLENAFENMKGGWMLMSGLATAGGIIGAVLTYLIKRQ